TTVMAQSHPPHPVAPLKNLPGNHAVADALGVFHCPEKRIAIGMAGVIGRNQHALPPRGHLIEVLQVADLDLKKPLLFQLDSSPKRLPEANPSRSQLGCP